MAKVKVKGTVIKQEISSVLTPVAQITEFDQSGGESETFDATTIDTSGAGKEYEATGYSEGGTFGFSVFYDPALSGHQAITDLITTPAECNWDITFADTGATNCTFASAGVGWDMTGAMNDGLKASVSLKLTGLFGYST